MACCLVTAAHSQIVINEIIPPNTVEIKNIGASPVPIGAYNLCDFPDYDQLDALAIQCGTLNLGPGEILAVTTDEITLNAADGELGLYLNDNNFGSPANIVDYVEWGSTGHTRSSVAQAAGIWSSGDFVPAWTGCASLEYDGAGNSSTDWTPTANPSTCLENTMIVCGGGVCSLNSAGLANVTCDDNNTGANPADDFIAFTLNPQGMNLGATYNVTVSSGAVIPTSGAYGGNTNFGLQPGSAGGGNVTVTVTDADDPSCSVMATIIDPGACSNACSLTDAGLANVACQDNGTPSNAADDIITFTLNPAGINLAAGYSVTVNVGTIMPTSGNYGGATPFSLQAGSAGSGNVMVTITDNGDPACQVQVMVADPGSCSNTCEITSVNLANINCNDNGTTSDDTDDVIEFTLNPVGSNLGGSYTVTVSAGSVTPMSGVYGGVTNFTLQAGSAGGGDVTVTVTDDGDPSCALQELITDPGSCSNACAIGALNLSNIQCDDNGTPFDPADDFIMFSLDPIGANTSAMYNVDVATGTITPSSANYGVVTTFSLNQGSAGAGNVMVTVADSGDPNCLEQTIVNDPGVCSACDVAGGSLATSDPTTVCLTDALPDMVGATVSGAAGTMMQWIITDDAGVILDLPAAPPFDFSGAGAGICLIWHLSYEPGISGLSPGNNLSGLAGCFDLSDSIAVTRLSPEGGMIMTSDPTQVCADDGEPDLVDVALTGNSGGNSAWVITDTNGVILSLPAAPPFDFEGAGEGICIIYHLSYEDGLTGLAVGENLADLDGCFDLSNSISVVRQTGLDCNPCEVNGGVIGTNDALVLCLIDNVADTVHATVSGDTGTFKQWVITDAGGVILSLPAAPPFDFSGTGSGVCLIWHLSYEDGLSGLQTGANTGNLTGCFDLSNALTVIRYQPFAGTITTNDTTTFCVGDGQPDLVNVTVSGHEGDSAAWVITDTAGVILGLPAAPPFDFETAGTGICAIWHLSYSGPLTGLIVGEQVANLTGCYALSNAIEVVREECPECVVESGTISTTSDTTICVGEGVVDSVIVSVSGANGPESNLVVTDPNGEILAILPSSTSVITFENAGAGTCIIYHIVYEMGLLGLTEGALISDLDGCYDLSNTITVIRLEGNDCTTAVFDPALALRIRMFPNPSSGQLTIEGQDLQLLEVEILDLHGKSLYAWQGASFRETWHLRADTGIYLVRVLTPEGSVTRKLVLLE